MGTWRLAAGLGLAALALAGCSSPLVSTFVLSTDAPSRTGLVPLDGDALAGNEAGAVLRISSGGQVRWRAELGREVRLPPVFVAGRVIAVTTAGDWVGLSADTGTEVWRLGRQPAAAALAAVGQAVWILTEDGELRALDALSGSLKWRRPWNVSLGLRGSTVTVGLEPDGKRVLVWGPAAVLALNAVDGSPLWRTAVRDCRGTLARGGRVWAVEAAGRLSILDEEGGSVRSRLPLGGPASSGPSAALGRVWVGLADRNLLGFAEEDPRAAPFSLVLPSPLTAEVVEFGARLAVPTEGREGRLLLVDLSRPGAPFDERLDSPLRTPPLVRGNALWQLAADGRILGFALRRRQAQSEG